MTTRKTRTAVVHFCLLLSAFYLPGCGEKKQKTVDERVPVTVAVAEQKDVPVQVRVIGSVQPIATVAVRALQVSWLISPGVSPSTV